MKALSTKCTYSNLNIDYDKINAIDLRPLREQQSFDGYSADTGLAILEKTMIKPNFKYYDKRKFSYPTYLVSEDYHITDEIKG